MFDPLSSLTFDMGNPVCFIQMGYYITIEDEYVFVPYHTPPTQGGVRRERKSQFPKRTERPVKKIKVKVEIDGQTFYQEKIYRNIKVTAKDVKVDIIGTTKPKIKITLI